MPCIFRRKVDFAPSEEHIIPQSLIGTEDVLVTGAEKDETVRFTLHEGQVCSECNSQLSLIDARLQDEFGLLRVYWNHVGTKRNRPVQAERPGLFAVRNPDGPHIVINSERHVVSTHTGRRVHPVDGKGSSLEHIRMVLDDDGGLTEASFVQPIVLSKKVIRAIYKIAFEALCFNRGAEKVLDPRYDGLRGYILRGRGSRSIGIPRDLARVPSEELVRRPTVGLQRIKYELDYMADVRLALPFSVDLTPDQHVRWPPDVVTVSDKDNCVLKLRVRMSETGPIGSIAPVP